MAMTTTRPLSERQFRRLSFEHRFFTGRGDSLMRWIGLPSTRAGYIAMLARAFPGRAGDYLLRLDSFESASRGSCMEDAEHLLNRVNTSANGNKPHGIAEGWRALAGTDDIPEPSPEQHAIRQENRDVVVRLLDALTDRERSILIRRYGLFGNDAMTYRQIAEEEGVSRSRVAQIEARAKRRLRHPRHRISRSTVPGLAGL